MNLKQALRFERFRLDRQNQELRHDSNLIALRPKTFAVLRFLAENPARLVTQDELLNGVWGPIVVGDGLLRGYIRDLRRALGDDAAKPRFIETIPRRGFRFLPKVLVESTPEGDHESDVSLTPTSAAGLVGRDQDLSTLDRLMRRAQLGKRQVIFIAGEAGIGKTALLRAFLSNIAAASDALIVCGQCVEQFGTREAYLPIFDALGQLCSGERASEARTIVGRYAPSWLAQMPGLLSGEQFQTLQKKVQGTTQSRMLGEFCEALEAFAAEQLFVLGLEDLQWMDLATLDLFSIVARREHRARLMVIGTYRPADVIVSNHPLRALLHDLQAHGLSIEVWPDNFTQAEVETYLAHRFPNHEFATNLKQVVHRKTAGNPLFVAAIVDELVRDKLIDHRDGQWQLTVDAEKLDAGKSASLRQLIEGQLSRLPAGEQRLLEVAAIVGGEFDSDLVTAALEIDPIEVEEQCKGLAQRRQILRSAQERSGESAFEHSRYEFMHDLYRNAAFERTSLGRRRSWYKRIAEKLAGNLGDRTDVAATELAYYFEQAGMATMAAQYCAVAGERAARRFANAEALGHFQRGIDLLRKMPESSERDSIELRLQVGVAAPLLARQGYRSQEVVAALSRALELNEKLGDGPQSFAALRGLYELLLGRSDYEGSFELCDKIDRAAQRANDRHVMADAMRLRGLGAFFLGRLRESQIALTESIATSSQERVASKVLGPEERGVSSASILALVQWMLGYPEQALRWGQYALDHANALGAPFSIAVAHCFRAMLMRFLRNSAATLAEADSAIAICDQSGFWYWRAQASLERGWAISMQGQEAAGLNEIRAALASVSLGAVANWAKLAAACLQADKFAEGLRATDEALKLVSKHKERAWEPELHRLKGELLIQRTPASAVKRGADFDKAERCFKTAIERAQANRAKSFELRAAMSLARLWSRAGKHAEAHRILNNVYGWFSEGFNTPDLVDARRLLDKR